MAFTSCPTCDGANFAIMTQTVEMVVWGPTGASDAKGYAVSELPGSFDSRLEVDRIGSTAICINCRAEYDVEDVDWEGGSL